MRADGVTYGTPTRPGRWSSTAPSTSAPRTGRAALVKTIQKVKFLPPKLSGGYDPSDQTSLRPVINEMSDVRDRWCRLVQEAPPPPDLRGGGGLTPPQLGSLTPRKLPSMPTSFSRKTNGDYIPWSTAVHGPGPWSGDGTVTGRKTCFACVFRLGAVLAALAVAWVSHRSRATAPPQLASRRGWRHPALPGRARN